MVVDFLPEAIRVQRARRRSTLRQGCLLVLCAAALVSLGHHRHGRVSAAQAGLAMLNDRSSAIQQQVALRVELETEQQELLLKQQVDRHLGSRVNALDIMGELQSLTPERVTLASLTIHATEMPVASAAGPGGVRIAGDGSLADLASAPQTSRRLRLVLTGLAPSDIDVANFIGQLAACRLFEDVNLGYSKTVEYQDHEAREFQASCFVLR